MTEAEQLEIIQTKLDEARASLGLPQEALGDGTLIKLILSLLSNPGQLTGMLNAIKQLIDFFKSLQPTQP